MSCFYSCIDTPFNFLCSRFQTIPNSQLQQQPKFIRIVSSGNALSTNSTPIKVPINHLFYNFHSCWQTSLMVVNSLFLLSSSPLPLFLLSALLKTVLTVKMFVPVQSLTFKPSPVRLKFVSPSEFSPCCQVLHTVPQQQLTSLVGSPQHHTQHHTQATLSTGTRTIKVGGLSFYFILQLRGLKLCCTLRYLFHPDPEVAESNGSSNILPATFLDTGTNQLNWHPYL